MRLNRREYFAIQILQALVNSDGRPQTRISPNVITVAILAADDLIRNLDNDNFLEEERGKKND